jgi:hypothetical protein
LPAEALAGIDLPIDIAAHNSRVNAEPVRIRGRVA